VNVKLNGVQATIARLVHFKLYFFKFLKLWHPPQAAAFTLYDNSSDESAESTSTPTKMQLEVQESKFTLFSFLEAKLIGTNYRHGCVGNDLLVVVVS